MLISASGIRGKTGAVERQSSRLQVLCSEETLQSRASAAFQKRQMAVDLHRGPVTVDGSRSVGPRWGRRWLALSLHSFSCEGLPLWLLPGKDNATHSSGDNPLDRGAWRATVHGVMKELPVTEATEPTGRHALWLLLGFQLGDLCSWRVEVYAL